MGPSFPRKSQSACLSCQRAALTNYFFEPVALGLCERCFYAFMQLKRDAAQFSHRFHLHIQAVRQTTIRIHRHFQSLGYLRI